MTKNSSTKKNSAAKKLVPAAGMLAVSAAMLASSTYAWFTMSREVEVKNIQMTASVPEDLQISLGKLTNIKTSGTGNPTAAEIAVKSNGYVGLQGNQGILDKGEGASADNGGVVAPSNNSDDAAEALYWSNTADISEYYRLGKIIPASSINGEAIYFTPDASGDGTTLKNGAKFYQAASLVSADFSTLYKWDNANRTFSTSASGDPARTTLHAITEVNEANDKWLPGAAEGTGTDNTYDSADSWYETNDDGYYVDIPMWIRSSAKDNTTLSVDAFVTTNAGKTDNGTAAADDELYMAARAAIIYASDVSTAEKATTVNTSSKLLSIRKDTFATTDSIINYMYSTDNSGDAVSGLTNTTATYGVAKEYDGDDIIEIPGRDEANSKKYGNMVKVVVRVWLEGEDPNCWNPNAGQDFNISLKFVKGEIKDGTEENASVAYPTPWNSGDTAAHATADGATPVGNGAKVTITESTINGTDGTLEFTYDENSDKWNQTKGSVEILDGKTYQLKKGETVLGAVTGAEEIATLLKSAVSTKADAAATYTIAPTT